VHGLLTVLYLWKPYDGSKKRVPKGQKGKSGDMAENRGSDNEKHLNLMVNGVKLKLSLVKD
jgi:hypothetical protein